MKLESRLSAETIRSILHGPDDQAIYTKKASFITDSGSIESANYELKRAELIQIIKQISTDGRLIDLIIADARSAQAAINSGATTREGLYPYIQEIASYIPDDDPNKKSIFTSDIVNFVGSYLIQKFGNQEEF